jgi:Tfp pilus assembly protein PilF
MTHDREAYALYLQGRAMIQKIGVEGAFAKGIAFLEQALSIDPEFAECWTALANAHIMTAAITPSLERVAQSAEAARCAERAIALDPGQGHAFSILGIHEWTRFNPARALEMAFEAYARDPNDADVCSRLGSCLLYLGKAREALPYVEAAVDRDPVYGRNYAMLTSAYLSLGEIDKAIIAGQRLADLGNPSMWLALAEMAAGDHETAVQTHFDTRFYLGTIIMRPPGMPPMDDAARDAYFAFAARGIFSGEEAARAAYCQMLDGLHAAMPDPFDSSIAFPAIWMGHSELVMKIYSGCIHPANMFGLMSLWIDIDPVNRTIRHPGFMDFAERIGMVEAWERFGWPDLLPAEPRKP